MSSNTDRLYWSDNHRKIYNGDCRSMYELANESVQMVCCSPPYWGLRKYSGEQDLIWGGDPNCGHQWESIRPPRMVTPGDKPSAKSLIAIHRTNNENRPGTISNTCSLCGAWKGQLGLEPTPELYLDHLVEICREIRRVLRRDGVFFLNIGDSYAGGKGQSGSRGAEYQSIRHDKGESLNTAYQTLGGAKQTKSTDNAKILRKYGIKPKDLCLIPFRLAIRLQEDGWYVRSVIIWSKPNPMPESVKDRPTESHEYILMLTKSARYYWDQETVREPQGNNTHSRGYGDGGKKQRERTKEGTFVGFKESTPLTYLPSGRNLRSVWIFPTRGFSGAHFAVFPEKLPEICIKAGTPEVGCCSKCGKPWVRIIKLNRPEGAGKPDDELKGRDAEYRKLAVELGRSPNKGSGFDRSLSTIMREALNTTRETLGWQPQCKCNADRVPSIVLDPFAGSGTTLLVASKLGRKSVGYELSEEYCRLIVERNRQSVFEVR